MTTFRPLCIAKLRFPRRQEKVSKNVWVPISSYVLRKTPCIKRCWNSWRILLHWIFHHKGCTKGSISPSYQLFLQVSIFVFFGSVCLSSVSIFSWIIASEDTPLAVFQAGTNTTGFRRVASGSSGRTALHLPLSQKFRGHNFDTELERNSNEICF